MHRRWVYVRRITHTRFFQEQWRHETSSRENYLAICTNSGGAVAASENNTACFRGTVFGLWVPNQPFGYGVQVNVKVGSFRNGPVVCTTGIFTHVLSPVDCLGEYCKSSHGTCVWLVVEWEAQCAEGLVDWRDNFLSHHARSPANTERTRCAVNIRVI